MKNTTKRLIGILLTVAMIVTLCVMLGAVSVSAEAAVDSDGDGYLEIGNVEQLYWFAEEVNSGNTAINVELIADITVNSNVLTASGDLNGDPSSFRAWTPIGNSNATAYCGTFEGNGYVISGLYAKEYGVGFFKKISSSGKVYNLGVMDSYFDNDDGGGSGYASGAIAGYLSSNGIVIENCFSNATIAGNNYLSGGLVGASNRYVSVKNCYYFGKTVGDPFANSDFSWNDSKSGNNYYVSTADDGCEFTTAITMEDVASGKLAYMLGGVFGQNIDNGEEAQSYPVINGSKVYGGYTTCDEAQTEPIYSNSDGLSETKPEHSNFVYDINSNEITKHCGECNKLMGAAAITATNGKYTGLPVSADVSATGEYASADLVVTYTDAEGNSATTAPTAIGSYTASITIEEKTVSTSFTISKGVMSVSVAPTATHEYGDTHLDKIISGKVVVEGNEAVEITGTWAWVGDTTTATFTPDAEFVDLFEALAAQSVTITVTQTTPIITVTSPSPSIMPGMSIVFDRVVENPHTDNPEKLPIHYRYVYKIGEGGELQYTSGSATKLTIPSDVIIGETIYVYVESYEYEDKYAVGISNTVKLLVGQVDYTESINGIITDLEAAKADLQSKIDTKADATALADAITALNSAIADAQTAAEGFATSADATLKEELQGEIDSAEAALQSAIDGVKAELEAAKLDLQANIDTKADASALADAITALNTAIASAQTAAEGFATSADATLKGELQSEIAAAQTTLQSAIDGVKAELEAAKADLQSKIDTKADATALADAITALNSAISNAQTAAESFATSADATLKEELQGEIDSAEAVLQSAIDGVKADLEQAKIDLQAAIDTKADATALADAINTLSDAIASAQTAAESFATSADTALKAELEEAIASAQGDFEEAIAELRADLEAAIDELNATIEEGNAANASEIASAVSQLNAAIDAAKAAAEAADSAMNETLLGAIADAKGELEAAVAALEAKIMAELDALKRAEAAANESLRSEMTENASSAVVLPTVVAFVAVAFCIGLLIFIIVDRKKTA